MKKHTASKLVFNYDMSINDNEVIHMSIIKTKDDYPMVLSPQHVQEILGIGRRGVYELLNDAPFVVKRIGEKGRFRIPKDSFFEWLEQ